MNTPMPRPALLAATSLAVLSLAGCGTATSQQRADAVPPAALVMGAGVQVIDSRRQPELKVRVSRAGGASESVLVEPRPPVTEALQKWVAESYTGPQPFFVGLERLEVLHIAGASTVELSCSIDSQVRVGGESGHRVRTTFRGQDSASTAITAAIQTVLSQCIQSHAKDINATAIMR